MTTTVPRAALMRCAPGLHAGQFRRADHPLRGRRFRHVHGDDVALRQQLVRAMAAGAALPSDSLVSMS
jgi:hypothetical protein